MSRVWRRNPPLIIVTVKGAFPASFEWDGKAYPIQAITNHWVLKGGLRQDKVHRHYFLVIARGDLWTEIFHDHLTDTWHLQRIHD